MIRAIGGAGGRRKALAERVGAEPEMIYVVTPVILDNVKGTIE